MNKGGMSTHYAQRIGQVNAGPHTIRIYVDREATLNEDLTAIDSRGMRGITLAINEGYMLSNEQLRIPVEIEVSRGHLAELRHLIDKALTETEGDQP